MGIMKILNLISFSYSIAFAVLQNLSFQKSRVLFSTHYHMLTDEFSDNPYIKMQHMSALVDTNSDSVTFLYKLIDGVCPRSYGMNVAHMAV